MIPIIRWDLYHLASAQPLVVRWITLIAKEGRAANTVDAYARTMNGFLSWCQPLHLALEGVRREHIADYIEYLRRDDLKPATISLRLTVVGLFYDYLVDLSIIPVNPVKRRTWNGHTESTGSRFRQHTDPWIPNNEQWRRIVKAAASEPLRNRFMLLLAYDTALRREELCLIELRDLALKERQIRIRPESAKNGAGRTVMFSYETAQLVKPYIEHRLNLSSQVGALFLSESPRNWGQPISKWTWTKVIKGIAERCKLPRLHPHTIRHLRLTDLARSGWDVHQIATYAGHRSFLTTQIYINLSGRDIAAAFARTSTSIQNQRSRLNAKVLVQL